MTIRATSSKPHPVARQGAKAAAPAPEVVAPTAPEARRTDRLELSSQAVANLPTETATTVQTSETVKPETTSQTPEVPKKPLRDHVPYFSMKPHFAEREPLIESALAGQTVSFTNKLGTSVALTITGDPDVPAGYERYRLKVGAGSLSVTIAPDQVPKELLVKVVEFYSRLPEHVQGVLKSLVLETRQNPKDAYWAETFGMTNFASAATAGGGNITFWNLNGNPINLGEDTFNHEMGHLVGGSYSQGGPEFATSVPPGWQEAAKADGDKVSDYAGKNPDEDFAETWSRYVFARTDAEAMTDLRARVPNRLKILEAIFDKTYVAPKPSHEAPQMPGGFWHG